MTLKEYIQALEDLAFKFENDAEPCDSKCKDCILNNTIDIGDSEVSYCEILGNLNDIED